MINIHKLLSIPRSLYFNIKWFGVRKSLAGGGPILISNSTKVRVKKGAKIIIENPCKAFMVQVGFGGTEGVIENKYSELYVNGELEFMGSAKIAKGSTLRIDGGTMKIGNNFSCNKNCFLSCKYGITIEDDVLLGWNVSLRDNGGHRIWVEGKEKCKTQGTHIERHVWIASYVDIISGVNIGADSVIGYRSLVTKDIKSKNVLIAGSPATIVKENINWNL